MQVRLRPMTDVEYDAFIDDSRRSYAAQIAAGGTVSAAAARAKAESDLARLLPAGRATAGHLFLRATDEGEEPVGHVWLALQGPGAAADSAWVYDVEVVGALRGRGYGRAIMEQAEQEARSRGVGRIGLNVFGFNTTAIELYRSLGYQVTAMQMTKALERGESGDERRDEAGG
ncbi:MAG: GNAT family N-acetyltransferase [Frankiaceae bacterium]